MLTFHIWLEKNLKITQMPHRQLTTVEVNRRQLTTDVVIFHRQLTTAEIQT